MGMWISGVSAVRYYRNRPIVAVDNLWTTCGQNVDKSDESGKAVDKLVAGR